MKKFVQKYFQHWSFFYEYLGFRIILLLILSVLVGLMDGLGLALFIPLLEVVSKPEVQNGESMGNLAFIVDWISAFGVKLNLTVVLVAMLILFSLKGLFYFIEIYFKVQMRMRFIRLLRFRMIDGMAELRYQEFVKSDAGTIQNSLSGEIGRVVSGFTMYLGTLQSIVLLTVYIVLAFMANAQFALLVLTGGVLTNFVYRSIYKLTKKLSKNLVDVGHVFQSLIIQTVHNYKYLRATASINNYFKGLKNSVVNYELIQRKMGIYNAILRSTREPLIMLVVVLVILIEVNWLGGVLATILMSLLFFYRSLNALMAVQTSWNSFLQSSGSLVNAKRFINELSENALVSGEEVCKRINAIELTGVSFGYTQQKLVLNDVNLSIYKNETIAIVGESGSGKSSLINLLSGLLDKVQGKYLINGKNYLDYNISSFQGRMGYITQEAVVFTASLYDNITFWAPKTEENMARFKDVLQKAYLTEFCAALPQKEDTPLGDNGIQISGGQKQRISIARELFKEVDVLLLDEATSALDSQTEKTIQKNLEALQGKYTLVMVAHRLSTVRNADRIVVLHQGKVEATGTFEELVQANSRFNRMVELQEF